MSFSPPRSCAPPRFAWRLLGLLAAVAALACGDRPWLEPQEATPAPLVEWVWSGAVTPSSATVKARVPGGRPVHLLASLHADLSDPIVSESQLPSVAAGNVVAVALERLRPGTVYHYAFAAGDEIDLAHRGRFRTFPAGPASFTVAFGSCATTGSSHPVWDAIRAADPLFFLHMGDFHYEDIASRRADPYRRAYSASLRAPRQARLYRSVPIAYVWDDHDFGGNSADATSRGRRTVRQVYQEIVPHYSLAAGSGDVPIEQSFTAGRLRFVLTDLRSERTPRTAPDSPAKTALGAAQKAWWKDELRAARDAGQLAVWVSTIPWIGGPSTRGDGWGAYAGERRELATFLAAQRIENLVTLSGDAHMVAIDDGSHSGYGPPGSLGFPVMHAAALDRSGSVKGGPYSEGAFPNPRRRRLDVGQFGLMRVRDDGGSAVCIDWSGHRVEPITGDVSELVRWGHCFDVGPPHVPAAR